MDGLVSLNVLFSFLWIIFGLTLTFKPVGSINYVEKKIDRKPRKFSKFWIIFTRLMGITFIGFGINSMIKLFSTLAEYTAS
jgi:threonine/homoserine/homoserine lactone efflux protein